MCCIIGLPWLIKLSIVLKENLLSRPSVKSLICASGYIIYKLLKSLKNRSQFSSWFASSESGMVICLNLSFGFLFLMLNYKFVSFLVKNNRTLLLMTNFILISVLCVALEQIEAWKGHGTTSIKPKRHCVALNHTKLRTKRQSRADHVLSWITSI